MVEGRRGGGRGTVGRENTGSQAGHNSRFTAAEWVGCGAANSSVVTPL